MALPSAHKAKSRESIFMASLTDLFQHLSPGLTVVAAGIVMAFGHGGPCEGSRAVSLW